MTTWGGLRLSLFFLARELDTTNHKSQYSVNESQYTEFKSPNRHAKISSVGRMFTPLAVVSEQRSKERNQDPRKRGIGGKYEESVDNWCDWPRWKLSV